MYDSWNILDDSVQLKLKILKIRGSLSLEVSQTQDWKESRAFVQVAWFYSINKEESHWKQKMTLFRWWLEKLDLAVQREKKHQIRKSARQEIGQRQLQQARPRHILVIDVHVVSSKLLQTLTAASSFLQPSRTEKQEYLSLAILPHGTTCE